MVFHSFYYNNKKKQLLQKIKIVAGATFKKSFEHFKSETKFVWKNKTLPLLIDEACCTALT
jgi:hypothetical protein